jgi:hypothetical protein
MLGEAMKNILIGFLFATVLFFIVGFSFQNGNLIWTTVVYPQVISAAPAQPFACTIATRGTIIFVEDTDDTAESFLCTCGIDADDATYIWLRVADPTANCF